MTGPWPRSERIDPARLADVVRAELHIDVQLLGPAEGGQVGACFVRWPWGGHSVLSWWPGAGAARWPVVERVVERLRAAGYPAPRYERFLPVDGGAVVVQERIVGRRVAEATPALVEQLLHLNDLQRNRFDVAEGRAADLQLTVDGPGFCLHEPLRAYAPRTRDLLSWIERVGEALSDDAFAGRDAVHFDFHPGNVVVAPEAARIAGVVDWTGARVGNCALDLVTLVFACERKHVDELLLSALRERIVERTSPAQLEAYCAHMSLRMVDWAIRHFDADEIQTWIGISERWRARVDTS